MLAARNAPASILLLALDLHGEELGGLVRVLGLGADLSDPAVLDGRLLVENIDHVVGHTLLSYNHLLAPVDDEVAALVIAAILAIFDPFVLI